MKTTTDGALYPNKKAGRAQTAALQLTHFYTQNKEEKSGCCHFLNYTIGGIFWWYFFPLIMLLAIIC